VDGGRVLEVCDAMMEIRNAEGVVVCAVTVQRGIELRGGC